jgi:ribose transport system permease protein
MQSAAPTTPAPEATSSRNLPRTITVIVGKYGSLIVLGLLFAYFSLTANYFLTWGNFVQIFNQAALTAIIAGGLTMVLAAGQFDLSIGNNASISGIIVSVLMINGFPIPVAIAAAILGGILIGLCNAFLVTRVGVNALVATLGVGSAVVGINYFISGGSAQPFAAVAPGYTEISVGNWLSIPRNVYYMTAVAFILWLVLNRTVLGRNIQAVGGNAEAARLAGVSVNRVTSSAFVIAGICASITGILLASVVGSGQPVGGDGFTLAAFAAAFLGTAVIREGQFHIIGTIVGVLTVAVGFNGLALTGVPSYFQFFFQGVLLIAAVSFSTLAQKRSKAS